MSRMKESLHLLRRIIKVNRGRNRNRRRERRKREQEQVQYSLSIHSVHHLHINLQLIQREQHPFSAVRTPSQINQIYLRRGGKTVI